MKKTAVRAIAFTAVLMLQGKILLVIFGEIQGLGFQRDPLTGIIAEFPAFIGGRFYPVFDAENAAVFQLRTMKTVRAGTFYFFTKQHNVASG